MLPLTRTEDHFWNPYLAGIALGLVLLTSFLVMGKGLGASGAANRLGIFAMQGVAPAAVQQNEFMAHSLEGRRSALDDYFVFEIMGVFLGGLISAYAAGRVRWSVIRGPRATVAKRLAFALLGGILMGVAARFGRGCTSGQALSGGALLSVGAWAFMLSLFGGGYALAFFNRRQWL